MPSHYNRNGGRSGNMSTNRNRQCNEDQHCVINFGAGFYCNSFTNMCERVGSRETKGGGNGNGYVIAGTNTPYTGMVLQINDQYFSTKGGAKEHDSQLLELVSTPVTANTGTNPVVRTFFASTQPQYFRPNGSIVEPGSPLHEHQDGTIMTEHSMGPNDNSVVVTTMRPRMRTSEQRTVMRNSRMRSAANRRSTPAVQQRTSTPRTNGTERQMTDETRLSPRSTRRTTRSRTTRNRQAMNRSRGSGRTGGSY